MAEAIVYGWECKLYVDSSASYAGTPGTPTWSEVADAVDVTLSASPGTLDVQPRAAGAVKVGLPGLIEYKISGKLHWTNGNTQKTALRAANIARATLNVMALLGASTDADAKGVKGDFFFSKWEESQENGQTVSVDFELTPAISLRTNYAQAATGVGS